MTQKQVILHKLVQVTLRKARIEHARTAAIVTSSNEHLLSNLNSTYWRFNGRSNVNGWVHNVAGVGLTSALKGRRCGVGEAVASPTFGNLQAQFLIHCVAPDGLYGPSLLMMPNGSAMRTEDLLQKTFLASLNLTKELGVDSVSLPAVGCGVKGWKASAAARAAYEAVLIFASKNCSERPKATSGTIRVDFFIPAEDVWRAWVILAGKTWDLRLDPTARDNHTWFVDSTGQATCRD